MGYLYGACLNMSRFGHELRPSDVLLDADIRWVLLAAFADGGPGDARPASPERAARLIHESSLVNQVTSRLSAAQLADALTPALQEEISGVARCRVMRSLAVVEARELVCRAADDAGVDVVLLKQAALEVMGLVTPAQRYATDVDLLLRPEDVRRLSDNLMQCGFVREKSKNHAHGVVVLRTADDIGVELHRKIIDLRLDGDDSVADFISLKERGLISPRNEVSPRIWIPSLSVVGAHLVAQGWYLFHFVPNAPHHKSPVRVIVDLGLLGAHRREEIAREIYGFVKHEVPAAEFFGLVELAGYLADGDLEHLPARGGKVLNHALAAMLDDDYRYSLLLNRQRDAIRREGILGWTRRQFQRALLPNTIEIERLIMRGEARNAIEARLRIPWTIAAEGLRGALSSLRRDIT